MYRYLFAAAFLSLAACSEGDSPVAPSDGPGEAAELTQDGPLLGRIVFSSRRTGGQGDIYVMNADGTGETKLTSSTDNEYSPAWSYDNQRIAYVRPRTDASNVVHQDIFLMDANGTNGHWASPTANAVNLYDPEWSPDGSRIVVWTANQDLGWVDLATGELKYFDAPTGGVRKGFYPSFDPTGQKIVFGGGRTLWIINADGTGQASQITLPSNIASRHPSFSPDGQKIVFSAERTDRIGGEIYTVGVNGSGLARLGSSPATDAEPSWSPDGKQIAFASDRSGPYQVYRINVTGSRRTRLSSHGVTDQNPDYSH